MTITCPNCGATDQEVGKFCENCGFFIELSRRQGPVMPTPDPCYTGHAPNARHCLPAHHNPHYPA